MWAGVVVLVLVGVCVAQDQQPHTGYIAFISSDNPTGYPQVALLPASANASKDATFLSALIGWNQYPRLSRDRAEVIWASGVEYGLHTPPSVTHLYKVATNLTSSSTVYKPVRLTQNKMDLTESAGDWSPNSSKIVVEYSWHSRDAGRAADFTRLAIVDNDGANWSPIMDDRTVGYNDYFARWNPVDPNIILFVSDRNTTGGVDPNFYLYNFDTDFAQPLNLPKYAGATGNGPSWAADGQSFYYEALLDEVWMVRATIDGNYEKLFQINLVDTVYYSGVYEYVQCVNGPDAGYLACTRTSTKGDAITITQSGDDQWDVTDMGNEVRGIYHWMPDWK